MKWYAFIPIAGTFLWKHKPTHTKKQINTVFFYHMIILLIIFSFIVSKIIQ